MKKINELNFAENIQKRNTILLFLLLIMALIIFPNSAFASGGVSEFTRPLELLADMIGGPWIKIIGVLSFMISGAGYVLMKKTAEEQATGILLTVMGLSVVLAASSFVANFFGFSGALIA